MYSFPEGFRVRINAFTQCSNERRHNLEIFFWAFDCRMWKCETWSQLYTIESFDLKLKRKTCVMTRRIPGCTVIQHFCQLKKIKLAHFTCCHYQGRQHAGLIAWVSPKVTPGHGANWEIQCKPEKKLVQSGGWATAM